MQVLTTIEDLQLTARALIEDYEREEGHLPRVGLTPTMGALHRGHGALIEAMAEDCGISIVSIFVNPAQFGPAEDFDKYPRSLEADTQLCSEAGADIIFAPTVPEIYPQGYETTVKAGAMAAGLCGKSRPVHFDGVLTVVLKLLNITQPDYAYFGEKDYQQLRLIGRMVEDFHLDCRIIACPIEREDDGLALSSRNAYLSADERSAAPRVFGALAALEAAFRLGEREVKKLRAIGAHELEPWTGNGFSLEYLEVVDPETLAVRELAEAGDRALIAVRLGDTRLIDNIEIGGEM